MRKVQLKLLFCLFLFSLSLPFYRWGWAITDVDTDPHEWRAKWTRLISISFNKVGTRSTYRVISRILKIPDRQAIHWCAHLDEDDLQWLAKEIQVNVSAIPLVKTMDERKRKAKAKAKLEFPVKVELAYLLEMSSRPRFEHRMDLVDALLSTKVNDPHSTVFMADFHRRYWRVLASQNGPSTTTFILNIRGVSAWILSRLGHANGNMIGKTVANREGSTDFTNRVHPIQSLSTARRVLKIWKNDWYRHICQVISFFRDRPSSLAIIDIDSPDYLDKLVQLAERGSEKVAIDDLDWSELKKWIHFGSGRASQNGNPYKSIWNELNSNLKRAMSDWNEKRADRYSERKVIDCVCQSGVSPLSSPIRRYFKSVTHPRSILFPYPSPSISIFK